MVTLLHDIYLDLARLNYTYSLKNAFSLTSTTFNLLMTNIL